MANRDRFLSEANQWLDQNDLDTQCAAIVTVSFDHAERISDSISIEAGDETLCALSSQLLSATEAYCASATFSYVARVGQEDFAILIVDSDVRALAGRLTKGLSHQFQDARVIGGGRTSLSLSIGVDPRLLEVELTETLIMRDAEKTMAVLSSIRELGCRVSIDDFGTGYSSLAYLKSLPVDTLKIDRAFVEDLGGSDEDRSICAAIVAVAHSLGLIVVAEGVETRSQLDRLADLGCDQVQGFLCGKPVPSELFAEQFLVRGNRISPYSETYTVRASVITPLRQSD